MKMISQYLDKKWKKTIDPDWRVSTPAMLLFIGIWASPYILFAVFLLGFNALMTSFGK